MSIFHSPARVFFQAVLIATMMSACSSQSKIRRTLNKVGAEQLRTETLSACRAGFAAGTILKVSEQQWPDSARAFQPMGLWAEPDGAYLLVDTDAAGERGIYLPRILSDNDPVCGPNLRHVKLADGVYWYDRKRG